MNKATQKIEKAWPIYDIKLKLTMRTLGGEGLEMTSTTVLPQGSILIE
jgi:hypothetical protein